MTTADAHMLELAWICFLGVIWLYWLVAARRAPADYGRNPTNLPITHGPAARGSVAPADVSIRERCLRLIRAAGEAGYTADALELELAAAHQTVTARLRELEFDGFIKDGGQRRPTRRNRQAVVYVATEAAE